MREMSWDYWTYRRQPMRVIDETLKTLEAESMAKKHLQKKGQ